MTDNPIYVALDTPDLERALELAKALEGMVGGLKLGLEFFYAQGPEGVARVMERGLPVFLDLKLHDIPNTVAGGLRSLGALKPAIVNVHATGGSAMMRAGLEALREVSPQTKLIGVTVLTSLDESDLQAMGVERDPAAQVEALALQAQEAGLDGVVCSPLEIAALRAACGADFLLVTPGIRPAEAERGDQKRVMTPAQAVAAGASLLVIGRPITGAPDPRAAAKAILADLERASQQ